MENWKPVVGWEGVYSVSDAGRVRYEEDRGGRHRVRRGDMVAQATGTDGYLILSLARVGEREGRVTRPVHALVAEAFLGPRPAGAQVNHLNGCKTDNAVENLEWTSPGENIRHSIERLGRDLRGVRSASAKLAEEQVLDLRARAARGETFKDLGRAFGLTNVGAAKVARGESYANVGGPLSAARDGAERRRLGIPNHAPGVRSNRQRKQ
jgi:hypothetical protein